MDGLCSLIIVSYNTGEEIAQCLDSVYAQRGVPYEVIVVDNASRDTTVDVIKERYPSVKLLRNEENLGFSKAVNQGIAVARGARIALLNDDVVLKDEFLREAIKALDSDRSLSAV